MLQSSRLTECRSFDEDDTWQRKRVCAHLSLCFLNGILQPRQEHEERFSFILDSCQTTERRHGAEIGPTLNRETRARAWSKMMNFEFKCPQCGQMVEADEAYRGQVAECPHCGKGIVVPRGKPKVQVGRKKSLVNVQGQSHSTVGSNSAFHKLVTDPPREVSNKWVWCLAIIPLVTVWTLSILVDSFVGY